MCSQKLLRLAVLLSAAAVVPAFAQSQDSQSQTNSVAEAARKARAEKKTANEKPAPVITDDILKPAAAAAPAASGDASVVQPGASNANGASAGGQAAGRAADDQGKTEAELKGLQGQVDEAQKALDLAKRQLALEQDNLYSKTDYQNDSAGKAKVDDLTQQVADKQQALDDLKAHLADVQAKAGAQTPPAQEPPPPPQL